MGKKRLLHPGEFVLNISQFYMNTLVLLQSSLLQSLKSIFTVFFYIKLCSSFSITVSTENRGDIYYRLRPTFTAPPPSFPPFHVRITQITFKLSAKLMSKLTNSYFQNNINLKVLSAYELKSYAAVVKFSYTHGH